jgi:hypothetical protein
MGKKAMGLGRKEAWLQAELGQWSGSCRVFWGNGRTSGSGHGAITTRRHELLQALDDAATGCHLMLQGNTCVLAKTHTSCGARSWRLIPRKSSSVGSASVLTKMEGGGGMS